MYNNFWDDFNKCPESHFHYLVNLFSNQNVDSNDILRLAYTLANSGKNITSYTSSLNTVDIPSTGGPSSLTTLLCPLYLANNGLNVVKLGVPGRPAGGIDILYQIPDYKIEFNHTELIELIKKGHYIHFLTNDTFAPLDGKLFAYRKSTGKVNIPYLAIASLLSKKIAVGVKNVGLDIRVWEQGNFGESFDESRNYASLFIKIAKKADINAKCFLSDASQPYQPYIGRGEALIAVYEIINQQANAWLQEHNSYCRNISSFFNLNDPKQNVKIDIKDAFIDNLALQGSSYDKFTSKVNQIIEEPHYEIYATQSGYCYYDLNNIRNHIVSEQNKLSDGHSLFPDSCGYTLLKKPGDYVDAGEKIALYRTICQESVAYDNKIYIIKQMPNENLCDYEVIE